MDDPVTPRRFAELRDCFRQLGRQLSDDQLLELADLYHELLRSRRPRLNGDVVAAPRPQRPPRSALARWSAAAGGPARLSAVASPPAPPAIG